MAWGRSNEEWNRTASLMTLIASIHSDPDKGSPPTLATYHPYLPEPEIPEATPDMLAALGIAMRRNKPAEVKHGG
jgi:hypothetical protein